MIRAKLKRADLYGLTLSQVNFQEANLIGAILEWASLDEANLKGAKLCEANLFGTNLRDTDMQGAILTKIELDYETQLKLPKPVFKKYRQSFRLLE